MPRGKAKAAPAPVPHYNTGDPQRVQVPAGQPYGQRQQMEQSQAAVPLAGGTPTAPPPGAGPPAGAPTPAPAPPTDQSMLDAATQYDFQPNPLVAPTNRPGEPVTAGLATGPGPGPDAMGGTSPQQADVQAWRPYLPSLEYLASQPNSTVSTRNFVRNLRSQMPPSATAR